jgi:peptidoglycan/LPS O-acetylase OafA/YrhL
MSFPIYLSQILVICSISSWTCEALVHAPHVLRILVCLCVTLVGTVLVAVPLAALDRWWLQWLGRFPGRLGNGVQSKLRFVSRARSRPVARVAVPTIAGLATTAISREAESVAGAP